MPPLFFWKIVGSLCHAAHVQNSLAENLHAKVGGQLVQCVGASMSLACSLVCHLLLHSSWSLLFHKESSKNAIHQIL